MTTTLVVRAALLTLAVAAPAAAQRPWVEARGPNVTVISDAGAGRARDVAWQFEQVREAVSRIFPWVRSRSSKPLLVLAARNETSMRALAPAYWEKGRDSTLTSVTAMGFDRAYTLLRSDLTVDDREGINPYESAYWGYASQALLDTSRAWPSWLLRGLAAVISNTLVRNNEIQLGRVLPQHLNYLRARGRMPLKEVVSIVTGADPRFDQPGFLQAVDAHAWAFVHFLIWADQGAHHAGLNQYIAGVLQGADPVTSVAATLGDVARFDTAFNVYVNRDLFGFTKFETSAKLSREGFEARDLPAAESATVRAAFHVAMGRPAEAKTLAAEAQTLEPAGVADEVAALLADRDDRDDDLRASLENAVGQRYASWYVPYRLATLLPTTQGSTASERIESLLTRATALNPNADAAWAYLGDVMATLHRGDGALEAGSRAIALMPASSAHRVSMARVLRALNRPQEALKSAGIARALAKTPEDRARATGILSELAQSMAAGAAAGPVVEPSVAEPAVADASPASVSSQPETSTDAPSPAGRRSRAPALTSPRNREAGTSSTPIIVLQADAQAMAKLEQACSGGASDACVAFATRLADSGRPGSMARARELLKKSCDAGSKDACGVLKQLPPGR